MGQGSKRLQRAPAAGMMGLTLVAVLAACGGAGGPRPSGTDTSPVTTIPTASAPAPTPTARISGNQSSLPIYWVAESRRSFALYREFRQTPDTGGPVSSAVSAMTRLQPLDPDYLTPWRPASRVTSSQAGSAITVDLSADTFANTQVGSELAESAVQQLVYTATAAAQQAGRPASSVRITVNGAAFEAWGAVRLGAPMKRAPMATIQAHTWVTSPQEGANIPAGTVTFKGFGTAFEANFLWEVRKDSGSVVAKGFVMGGGGDGTFGEFMFTAKLEAGSYSVEVSGDDASGGAEGPGAAADDKTFTVS